MRNACTIRGVCAAFQKGDIASLLAAMAPDIAWNEAGNFPYADNRPYVGRHAIVAGVLAMGN